MFQLRLRVRDRPSPRRRAPRARSSAADPACIASRPESPSTSRSRRARAPPRSNSRPFARARRPRSARSASTRSLPLVFIRRICAAVAPSVPRSRGVRVASRAPPRRRLGRRARASRLPASRRRTAARPRPRPSRPSRRATPADADAASAAASRASSRGIVAARRARARARRSAPLGGAEWRPPIDGARDALARALRALADVALDEDEIAYVLDGAIDADGTCAPREEFVEFVWPVVAPWVDDDEARARTLAGRARDGVDDGGDDDDGGDAPRRPRAGAPGRGLARGRRAGGRGATRDDGGGGRRERVRRDATDRTTRSSRKRGRGIARKRGARASAWRRARRMNGARCWRI